MFFAFCFFIFLVYLHQTTPEELALEPEQTEIVTPDSLSPGSKRLINVSPKDTKVTPLRSPKHPNDVTPKSAPLPPSRQSIEEFQTRRPFRHPNLRPPQTALPTPTSGQDSLSPTPPSVDRYFSIQVASFESWENAKQAADQYLVELGEATVIHPLNDHTYKILLGQFPTEIEARQYAERHGLLPMLWPRPGAE
ncbi:MAG: SPOR domain-containing protein [Bacteroidota bacterium]